jgi:hypothetical protein
MKLAEALLLRADIQKKLASLQMRAQKYAVVQEGETPAENPNELLRQIEAVTEELARLVFRVNKANLAHTVRGGETLTEALARCDALQLRHGALNGVVEVCAKPPERYGVKEIRWVRTVDVAALQKRVTMDFVHPESMKKGSVAKCSVAALFQSSGRPGARHPRAERRHPGGWLAGRTRRVRTNGRLRVSASQRRGMPSHLRFTRRAE